MSIPYMAHIPFLLLFFLFALLFVVTHWTTRQR